MDAVILDAEDIKRTLGRMAHEILEDNQGAQDLVVVGIMKRGYPIAKRLAFLMTQIEGVTVPCGKLDPRAYRDDRPAKTEDESEIPFEVTGKRVILVDELIFTGRTIRAGLDGLIKYGRPSYVRLGVLLDRGHRELPIQPDYCGRVIQTERSDHVFVKVKEFEGEDLVELRSQEAPHEQ
ncbi:MAG: bifunctional pyr operon transcriptional regulator/uracil phosphoribosyltransferase PyrR [Armatimonadetes bacterium]|nr:bifunctional pyr operon transcriptional regulator/uracil phosphoribosyltransferase PyrR [Armatimonadota bacterium]MBS1703971.1 bifunctional pyr operon transcriptional regulator/uracil phosphoribosyltransferase PyrR [Armatimonadota bacterium]MBS1727979.1 bifunctional pyr operon transcriptional regulator/uracil phosphoribosyltransferase PyrR [Armatimonadota bacterium]